MNPLEWTKRPSIEVLGSDRVSQQYTAVYGKFNLWVENCLFDDGGEALSEPYWTFWFSLRECIGDIYVCETQYDDAQGAFAAAERLVGRMR